jgi:hypothetical protein
MSRKKTKHLQPAKRAEDYQVGEQLWEGDYSAGTIIFKMDCPERPTRVWLLLRNSKKQYTLYTVQKHACCHPTLSRKIPESVIHKMFMQTFMGVELPDKIADSVRDREPVSKKKSQKSVN